MGPALDYLIMKNVLLTTLRSRYTLLNEFRSAADRLGEILAIEAGGYLPQEKVMIETPLEITVGSRFSHPLVLVAILRSGLAMLTPFMRIYPMAKAGMLGIKRDEETKKPTVYYRGLPALDPTSYVFILDPMIATGGTALEAIRLVKKAGVNEENIIFISYLSSKYGVDRIKQEAKNIRFLTVQEGEELDPNQFILPGLGDFGDRYFGTEPNACELR